MNAATRRRATSRVTLLATSSIVLTNRIDGKVMCRQSFEAPCRTIRALVNAANDMHIAAMPTQMALLDGGGEYSSIDRKFPSDGTRFCQPPLPVFPFAGLTGCSRYSDFGGGTVVAIFSTPFLSCVRCVGDQSPSPPGKACSGEFCMM